MEQTFWVRNKYSLWLSWIIATMVYVLSWIIIANLSPAFEFIPRIMGLFIPIGIGLFAIFYVGSPLALFSIPVFLGLMASSNGLLNKFNMLGKKRIILNLLFLFVITNIIDLLIFGNFHTILFILRDYFGLFRLS